ncbi:hypothetical protein [Nocardia brasiliensis]|uniref:hypothetical protein n=1 Tax=Nocardia brasiliensis TaxID=37326 RepID=UPI003D9101F3
MKQKANTMSDIDMNFARGFNSAASDFVNDYGAHLGLAPLEWMASARSDHGAAGASIQLTALDFDGAAAKWIQTFRLTQQHATPGSRIYTGALSNGFTIEIHCVTDADEWETACLSPAEPTPDPRSA